MQHYEWDFCWILGNSVRFRLTTHKRQNVEIKTKQKSLSPCLAIFVVLPKQTIQRVRPLHAARWVYVRKEVPALPPPQFLAQLLPAFWVCTKERNTMKAFEDATRVVTSIWTNIIHSWPMYPITWDVNWCTYTMTLVVWKQEYQTSQGITGFSFILWWTTKKERNSSTEIGTSSFSSL